MNELRKTVSMVLVCIVILGAVFASGYWYGKKGERVQADIEYANRLSFIVNVNRELQSQNQRLAELNKSVTSRLDAITDRLNRAGNIIDGFFRQVENDGNTIQRLAVALRQLEQIISEQPENN